MPGTEILDHLHHPRHQCPTLPHQAAVHLDTNMNMVLVGMQIIVIPALTGTEKDVVTTDNNTYTYGYI
jgi:hypothetical protein